MAKSIPIEWLLSPEEMGLYSFGIVINSNPMTCGMSHVGSRSFSQTMVNQTPRYDNAVRKRKRRVNQVLGKSGIIRPDKRVKAKYF